MTNRPRLASRGSLIFICVVYFICHTLTLAADKEEYSLEYVSSFGGGGADWIKYGDAVYLLQEGCIRTIDLRDPKNPREAGVIDLSVRIEKYFIKPPALYLETREFGHSGSGFRLIDLSDPLHPKDLDNDVEGRWSRVGLSLDDNILSFQNRDYDVSDPLHPRRINNQEDEGSTKSQTIQAAPPKYKTPSFITSKNNPESSISQVIKPWALSFHRNFKVQDGKAYNLDTDAFRIVDVRDPARPHEIGEYANNENYNAFALSGKLALMTGSDSIYLSIVDISLPTSPTLLSRLQLPSYGGTITVSGTKAYFILHSPASENGQTSSSTLFGLQIVDFSNPTHPRLMGFHPTQFDDLVVSGTLAYLMNTVLEVVDVSNPDKPVRLGLSELKKPDPDMHSMSPDEMPLVYGAVSDLNLSGRQVVAMGSLPFVDVKGHPNGLINFFDVSDPHHPVWKKAMGPDIFCDVWISGRFFFVHTHSGSTTDNVHSLDVYEKDDFSNNPLASYDEFSNIDGIEAVGDMVYVVDSGRLVILKLKHNIIPVDSQGKNAPERTKKTAIKSADAKKSTAKKTTKKTRIAE